MILRLRYSPKYVNLDPLLAILLVILDIVKYILVLSFIDDEPRQLRYVLDNELFLRLSSLQDPEYFVIN